jgi:fluoride exporter
VGYLLAAVGGALGALARWGVAEALPRPSGAWPWATLAVNLTGCLLIGVLLAVLAARRPDDLHLRTFLAGGVLGGFTTFSAFAVEVADLLRTGASGMAVGYVAVSVLGGLLAVAAGLRLGALSGRSRA